MMTSKNFKTLAIIPARGGSKRIPRKNLHLLGGKPLIAYTIEAAKTAKSLSRVIVSTDDLEISSEALKLGADIPFLRPKELASDNANSIDVILHALQYLELEANEIYKYVVLLQPTVPLRTAEDIDSVVRILHESGADSVFTLSLPLQDNPLYMYQLDEGKPQPLIDLSHYPCSAKFPTVYVRNGAVYAVKCEVLLNTRSLYGEDARTYIMPRERSVNIDEPFDLAFAEYLLKYQK